MLSSLNSAAGSECRGNTCLHHCGNKVTNTNLHEQHGWGDRKHDSQEQVRQVNNALLTSVTTNILVGGFGRLFGDHGIDGTDRMRRPGEEVLSDKCVYQLPAFHRRGFQPELHNKYIRTRIHNGMEARRRFREAFNKIQIARNRMVNPVQIFG